MAKSDMGSTSEPPGPGRNSVDPDRGSPDSGVTDSSGAISEPGATPGPASTNPFDQGRTGTTGGTGGVNPSDPTTGTEGWGLGANEDRTTGRSQGQLGAKQNEGGNTERGKLGRTERDDVPLGERTFRCADAGNADCRWETSARTEDELIGRIERHGREAHGISNFDEASRRKIINAIRERRAA